MSGKIEEKKTGVYKNLITGGVSASIARTITNPIERVEILRQIENNDFKGLGLFQTLNKIYKTQGISGLFKGNIASVARVFPFSAFEFYFIEFYKNLIIRGKENRNNFFFNFLCGGLTGLSAATLTFPLDVARTRLAATTINSAIKENHLTSSLYNLYKNEGIRGLYKGYSVASFGTIFFIAIKQTLFDFFKNKFIVSSPSRQKDFYTIFYGSLSGTIGTFIMYPCHLIKRVLQANNDKDLKLTKYLIDLKRRHGFKGFYMGFSMTLLKTAPYIGITFWCNERLKQFFKY